jgi:hypothetical protein
MGTRDLANRRGAVYGSDSQRKRSVSVSTRPLPPTARSLDVQRGARGHSDQHAAAAHFARTPAAAGRGDDRTLRAGDVDRGAVRDLDRAHA